MWRIYSVDNVLFILHRITGIGLLVYLLVHIWTVSTAMLGGPELFDRVMTFFARPEVIIFDLLLLGSVTFHTVNGLRLLAHERGLWLQHSASLAHLTLAGWLGVWAAAVGAAIVVA